MLEYLGISGYALLLISAFYMLLSGFFGLTNAFHTIQQNSYYNKRYIAWLRKSGIPLLFGYIALLAVTGTFLSFSMSRKGSFWFTSMMFLSVILLAGRMTLCRKKQKTAIKPLVLTPRIKRMYVTASLVAIALFAGIIYGSILVSMSFTVFCFAASLLSPISALIINGINRPMENIISGTFVREAKKIIKTNKRIKVVGVTGSYGKTGTKFILERILSENYNVVATPKSFNTTMGVVRTVRENLPPQTDIFVCEMGAKNKNDIKEICDVVDPYYGVITAVGPQHLETFKTIENVINTKFELAESVIKKGGTVFLNTDNEYIKKKAENLKKNGAKVVTYGTSDADYVAKNISYGRNGSSFDLCFNGKETKITTKLLGKHNVINITGAAAVADHAFALTEKHIKFAAANLTQTEHRLQLRSFNSGATMIDDAYNSNPEGCLEAVNVLSNFEGMKKIIITPGLVELGEKEYECNYNLGKAAAAVCDEIILVGKKRSEPMVDALKAEKYNMQNCYVASSFSDAVSHISPSLDSNCVVLVENDLPDNYLE